MKLKIHKHAPALPKVIVPSCFDLQLIRKYLGDNLSHPPYLHGHSNVTGLPKSVFIFPYLAYLEPSLTPLAKYT